MAFVTVSLAITTAYRGILKRTGPLAYFAFIDTVSFFGAAAASEQQHAQKCGKEIARFHGKKIMAIGYVSKLVIHRKTCKLQPISPKLRKSGSRIQNTETL
tara:strand:- start:1808 stop:2110 length:303 start_codon:yes stop_codon:yes gene_type:complete